MSYATYAEFNARYSTKLTEAEVNSDYLPFATSRLEGLLGGHFTVPFSSNNMTAKDITIDLAYLMILQRSREPKDFEGFGRAVNTRLSALTQGAEAMMTTSGEAIFSGTAQNVVWSNTARYKTVFNLKDALHQKLPEDVRGDAP